MNCNVQMWIVAFVYSQHGHSMKRFPSVGFRGICIDGTHITKFDIKHKLTINNTQKHFKLYLRKDQKHDRQQCATYWIRD